VRARLTWAGRTQLFEARSWCFLLSHAETALIAPRSLAMLEIENRPFYRDVSEPLLIARNLVRIYDQVLGEPLPAELVRLVARLETSTNPGEHRTAALDDGSQLPAPP
jgi:hypothetical protein